MSFPYCFWMHKHTWRFHLYQHFSWLIKMQPDWHDMGLYLVLKCPCVVKNIWLQFLFFFHKFTKQWLKHFIEAPHVFLWSLGIVVAATVMLPGMHEYHCEQSRHGNWWECKLLWLDRGRNGKHHCLHSRMQRVKMRMFVSVWLRAVF